MHQFYYFTLASPPTTPFSKWEKSVKSKQTNFLKYKVQYISTESLIMSN